MIDLISLAAKPHAVQVQLEPLPPPGFVWATFDDEPEALEDVDMPVQAAPASESPFVGVLRSKGTAWLDSESPRASAVWSHAGRHFRLTNGGVWWCTLPKVIMRQCFDSPDSLAAERVNFEGEDGDRRQELVFIGTKFNAAAITSALDECLCTDDEMEQYRTRWADETAEITRETGPLRFKVGDRVTCNIGPDRWARGFVASHHYREYDWPSERWAPYRIELDDDTYIWAPSDVRGCIRTLEEDPGDDLQIRCRACRRRVTF